MKKSEIPECLKYAGLMGHRWIVTIIRNGKEETQTHVDTYGGAFEAYFEHDAHAIYQRTKKGWKRIR